jgi:hypothetical protein
LKWSWSLPFRRTRAIKQTSDQVHVTDLLICWRAEHSSHTHMPTPTGVSCRGRACKNKHILSLRVSVGRFVQSSRLGFNHATIKSLFQNSIWGSPGLFWDPLGLGGPCGSSITSFGRLSSAARSFCELYSPPPLLYSILCSLVVIRWKLASRSLPRECVTRMPYAALFC